MKALWSCIALALTVGFLAHADFDVIADDNSLEVSYSNLNIDVERLTQEVEAFLVNELEPLNIKERLAKLRVWVDEDNGVVRINASYRKFFKLPFVNVNKRAGLAARLSTHLEHTFPETPAVAKAPIEHKHRGVIEFNAGSIMVDSETWDILVGKKPQEPLEVYEARCQERITQLVTAGKCIRGGSVTSSAPLWNHANFSRVEESLTTWALETLNVRLNSGYMGSQKMLEITFSH